MVTKPPIDGRLSRQQHEFLKQLANRINERETRIAMLDVKGNEKEKRALQIEQLNETREMAFYLDLLTEPEGYKQLQGHIDKQKLLTGK